MKKNITVSSIFMAALLLVPAITVFDVMAQSPLPQNRGSEISQTNIQEDDTSDDESSEQTREERKAERKQRIQEKLDAAREARIVNKCQAAQQVLANILNRSGNVENARTSMYANLVSRLNRLAMGLDDKGLDTAELLSTINGLEEKVSEFFTAIDEYQLALSDGANLDCENDPEGFHLALEDARQGSKDLKQMAADIRTYLAEDVKDALQELKAQFSGRSDDASSTNDTENENIETETETETENESETETETNGGADDSTSDNNTSTQ